MAKIDYEVAEDLIVKKISVSLSNNPKYTTNFNLSGLFITMNCGYNTRNGLRWVSLTDNEGEVIMPQTILKFGKRCELGFNAEQYDLYYYITLKPKKSKRKIFDSSDYLNWADHFSICFVGYENSIRERMAKNLRVLYVGN